MAPDDSPLQSHASAVVIECRKALHEGGRSIQSIINELKKSSIDQEQMQKELAKLEMIHNFVNVYFVLTFQCRSTSARKLLLPFDDAEPARLLLTSLNVLNDYAMIGSAATTKKPWYAEFMVELRESLHVMLDLQCYFQSVLTAMNVQNEFVKSFGFGKKLFFCFFCSYQSSL
jgi:hypothetical protein